MQNIYKPANKDYIGLIENFRQAFVRGDKEGARLCFDEQFGIHMGSDLKTYIEHEMEEFKIKCQRFGLSDQGHLAVYQIDEDRIYFHFGTQADPALFEAVWKTNPRSKKLVGNQSQFRWEPKLKFTKSENKEGYVFERSCNIKDLHHPENQVVWWRLKNLQGINMSTHQESLEEALGGVFSTIKFSYTKDRGESKWETIRVASSNHQTESTRVWMRGVDHPLLKLLAFPEVDFEQAVVKAHHSIHTVVVLWVLFEDHSTYMVKYPKERTWAFKSKIKSVCITDGLSYDWVVHRTNASSEE